MIKNFFSSNLFLLIVLCIFSFFVNYHYASIGVLPRDNFVLYNGGYRVLNGYIPFTDYWLVTGPLLDYLNAFFFTINGISWNSYIIHSSIFNSGISLMFYFLLVNLNLNKNWCFFYSLLFSILMYSVVGTPFVDHHSTIFLILSFFLFIFYIQKENYLYLVGIPTLFILSFLSKQTPAAYGIISLSLVILIYIFFNKQVAKTIILTLITGSLFSFLFLFCFFYFTEINVGNFIEQYILFAKTIGEYRISNYDFDIIDIIVKYKFIVIMLLILFVISILMNRKNSENKKDVFIIFTIFVLSILLIFHQLITSNQNYIFFLIPFLASLIHVFYFSAFKKNKSLLIISVLICIFAVGKYHLRFNEHRKFNELENVNLSKSVEAKIIHESLDGLMWITSLYPDNPMQEINDIREAMEIIKKDGRNKTLITDYQFIAPSLSIYDFSPNQWYHGTVSYPMRGQKYFKNYQNFFIKQLKKNNIEIIYSVGDGTKPVVKHVMDMECFRKQQVGNIIYMYELNRNCEDFE